MSKQKGYLRYRFFKRLFLSTTLLIAITILLATGLLYAIFSNAMIDDSSRNTLALLRKTSYSADVVYNEVQTLCSTLLSDTTIYNYLTIPQYDPVREFLTFRRLNDIVKVYPDVFRIGIYNADTSRYLTSLGYAKDQAVDRTSIDSLLQNKTGYISFIPQIIYAWPDPNNSGATTAVLTYVVHPGWVSAGTKPSGFIIHIRQNYLQDTLNGLINSSSDNIFVMNEKGMLLSSSKKGGMFLTSLGGEAYAQNILRQTVNEGSFTTVVDGRKELVSFVRSDTGWYFVNMQTYRQLLENITNIRNLMLVIAATILMAGTTTAFITARKLYDPIGALLAKFNVERKNRREDDIELLASAYSRLNSQTVTLQNTLESSIPIFKDAYLRSLLSDPKSSLPSVPQLLQQLEAMLTGPCFFVVLIRIADYEAWRASTPEPDQMMQLLALNSIAHDIIGKAYPNNALSIGDNEVVVIAQSDGHQPHAMLRLAIEEMRQEAARSLNLKFAAAIGDWVDNRQSINLSYSTAKEYIQYTLFYGLENTIDRPLVIDRLNSPGEYPAEADNRLISALERLDAGKVEECVERFFEDLAPMSYENALSYAYQFMVAPVKHFSGLLNVGRESAQSYYKTVHSVTEAATLREMAEASCRFMLQILERLLESKNLCSSQKLKNVMDWINANYHDSNISLEIIADKFEISPGYLGRLLYGINYCHFNDYLNNLRLGKAAELLTGTSLSTEQICKEVGINNTNYFYTLFKKQYHMTPASYRKKTNQ